MNQQQVFSDMRHFFATGNDLNAREALRAYAESVETRAEEKAAAKATPDAHPYDEDAFAVLVQRVQEGDVDTAREGFMGYVRAVVQNTHRADARKIREWIETGNRCSPTFRNGARAAADFIEADG